MKLNLYREDLKPECENISCSLTLFEHFNPAAQNAIRAAGKGTFYTNPGTQLESYNVIYPPSEPLEVYLVTSGEYEDLRIQGIYSTEEKAKRFIEQGRGERFEVWPIDEGVDDTIREIFFVEINIDTGEQLSSEKSSMWLNPKTKIPPCGTSYANQVRGRIVKTCEFTEEEAFNKAQKIRRKYLEFALKNPTMDVSEVFSRISQLEEWSAL